MPIYLYKAKNLKGEELKGEYEAITTEALKFMLSEKGYFMTECKKKPEEVTFHGLISKVNTKDLSVFCRQLSVILNAGITIVEAIAVIRDQSEKKKMLDALDDIHEELQKGKVLSEGLDMYPDIFPDFLRSMVKVGEASGSLDTIMDRLADYYERENKIKKKISSAMTYPIILFTLTIFVVIILLVKVLPMFADILNDMGGQMPLITVMLMGLSSFIVNNLIILTLLSAFGIAVFSYWLKSEAGKFWFDELKLNIPIIKKTNVKVMTSRFARSMGILLNSGIPVVDSIDLMADLLGNRVIQKKFQKTRDLVKEGHGIAGPLKKLDVFPPLLIHMVTIGEKTGELDQMLTRTAGFFDQEVEEAVEKMTTLLEPIMLLILAVIVGTILMSVMLPMMNIMGTIG